MTLVLIGVYIVGFFLNIIVAGTVYDEGKKELGARLGLLTPVWPLTLAYGLYVLVGFLWQKSGWNMRKDRA